MTDRPPYWLGAEWTPTSEQVAQARERQRQRRDHPRTQWRRLTAGPELDLARTSIVRATDYGHESDDIARQMRLLRGLAFDAEADIFVRNFWVTDERYLIEFRHPRLRAAHAPTPIGLRFIGLSREAWTKADFVGLILDGSQWPLQRVFALKLDETVHDHNLAEAYVRFVYDHVDFNRNEFYVVADRRDFLVSPDGLVGREEPESSLVAQFRVSRAAPAGEPTAVPADTPDPLFDALDVSEDALVPPTVLRTEQAKGTELAHAIVFATMIFRSRLFHVCLKVSADGTIEPLAEKARTPEGSTLPLVPLRSFDDQRGALMRAIAEHDLTEIR